MGNHIHLTYLLELREKISAPTKVFARKNLKKTNVHEVYNVKYNVRTYFAK